MKSVFLSVCVLMVAVLMACQSKNASFQSISVEEFAWLIADPDVQRLDVRTLAEFSEGHIPGSLNVNVLDENSFLIVAREGLTVEKPVALYCRSGKRSKKAAEILSKAGYHVYELAGGFNAWKAAGKEMQSK